MNETDSRFVCVGSRRVWQSAQVRGRLLFRTELEIDYQQPPHVFDREVLGGLVEQYNHMNNQRDNLLKGLMINVFAMFLVANGQDFDVPGINLTLSAIPALKPFLLFVAATQMVLCVLIGSSVATYRGLIEEFSIKAADVSPVDPEIITSSILPNWLVIKIFRKKFSFYHDARIKPARATSLIYQFCNASMGIFFFTCIAAVYLFIVGFGLLYVGNDVFSVIVKVVSFMALFVSVVVHFAANIPLPQDEDVFQETIESTELPDVGG